MDFDNLSPHPVRPSGRHRRAAFTLVELLVVIGIIALLIGILLPTLSAAREQSKRAKCAAQLHAIMLAATIHVAEHKGYYPLAGQLNFISGITMDPAGLNDKDCQRYTWMGFSGMPNGADPRSLAPITFALGTEMGQKRNLDAMTDAAQFTADIDSTGVIRNFLCPSQAATTIELPQGVWLYGGIVDAAGDATGYTEQLSYAFNEYVLGYEDSLSRLRGQASRVRQSAKTMFCCDALGGSTVTRLFAAIPFNQEPNFPKPPWPFITFYNVIGNYAPITLGDALAGNKKPNSPLALAGDPQSFDQIRHKGKMNIAFCDGHVELRSIPVFTMNGQKAVMKSDLTAKGLADVYIVAP